MNLSVIGTGSWGIALANAASEKASVKILARRKEISNQINEKQKLDHLFPNVNLKFAATCDVKEINDFSDNVLIVVPMKHIKQYCIELKKAGLNPKNIISASKGFDKETLKTGSQIIKEIWPEANVGVLSGPSHAESLVKKAYTSVMISSKDEKLIQIAKDIFKSNYFNLYKSDDVFGTELYGAAKNVYSIGAGALDAMKMLDNTKAAYITRSITELARLGKEFNVSTEAVFSLAGLGDLLVTAYSSNSRNYQYGKYVVTQNKEDKPIQTVEGLNTVESLYKMMQDKNVRMPILDAIYKVVIENHSVKEVAEKLLKGANNE